MKRLLFLTTMLLLPMFVMAQNPQKVAVYVMGEDTGIKDVLESKLVSAISRSEEYTAIERTAAFLSELNKEQGYQRTGAVDDSELSRLGKQFGVQYICVAAVSEVFNEKYLSARLIDVESAQVERTASSSGIIQSLTDIVNAANAVSGELLSSLGARRQSETKKVAVYIVKNDAARNIGRVFGDKLVAGFANSGRYIAIERTSSFLQQLSKEQNYQRTGAVDDNEISRLGKQFGVQYVCVADVSDILGEKYISARLINVETAEVVNTHDVAGVVKNMGDCVRMANEIAMNLSKGTYQEQQTNESVRSTLLKAHGLVDLGLPSGTLWKTTNEEGFYDHESAVSKYGSRLPTREQWEELKRYCKKEWTSSGFKVVGPSGNFIILPTTSGDYAYYWSSSYSSSVAAYSLAIGLLGGSHDWFFCGIGLNGKASVRLVQNPEARRAEEAQIRATEEKQKRTEESKAEQASEQISEQPSVQSSIQQSETLSETPSEVRGFVDLGLPSGTRWKATREKGLFNYRDAVKKFGRKKIPTIEKWHELGISCKWNWLGNGYLVTGPNDNSIFISITGYCCY